MNKRQEQSKKSQSKKNQGYAMRPYLIELLSKRGDTIFISRAIVSAKSELGALEQVADRKGFFEVFVCCPSCLNSIEHCYCEPEDFEGVVYND